MRYYWGDWFNTPLMSRAKSPTISVLKVYYLRIGLGKDMRLRCGIVYPRLSGTNVTTYRFYIRLWYVIISSLHQPHPQHHPSRVRPVNAETSDINMDSLNHPAAFIGPWGLRNGQHSLLELRWGLLALVLVDSRRWTPGARNTTAWRDKLEIAVHGIDIDYIVAERRRNWRGP